MYKDKDKQREIESEITVDWLEHLIERAEEVYVQGQGKAERGR